MRVRACVPARKTSHSASFLHTRHAARQNNTSRACILIHARTHKHRLTQNIHDCPMYRSFDGACP